MTFYALEGVAPKLPDDGDFWVSPNAQVIGKVTLESHVSIWFGVVLRGDNDLITVGAGSNVQDNTVIHTDLGYPATIGKDCTIGHGDIIHGCTIGDNSLVGMGATVLNGAVIGRNCLIGAGALVTEGKVIPDGSLVIGMPAKALRRLGADEIEGLRQSALHYQNNFKRYRNGLVEV